MPNTLTYDSGDFSLEVPPTVLAPVDGVGWENPAGASEPMIWGPTLGEASGRLFESDDSSGDQLGDAASSGGLVFDWEKLQANYAEELASAIQLQLETPGGEAAINNFIQVLFPTVNANDLFGQFQSGSVVDLVEELRSNVGDDLPGLVNDLDLERFDVNALEAVVDQLTGAQGGELLLPTSPDEITNFVDNILQVGESVLSRLEASDVSDPDSFGGNGEPVVPEVMNQELASAETQAQKLSSESFWFQAEAGIMHLGSTDAVSMAAPTIENRTAGRLTRPSDSTELFWWQPPGGIGTWEAGTSA